MPDDPMKLKRLFQEHATRTNKADPPMPTVRRMIERGGAAAEERMWANGTRGLASEIDRKIAGSTRLTLMAMGYRGELLDAMRSILRGNAELREAKRLMLLRRKKGE